MGRVRSFRPSGAMVVALVALFFSLGGPGYGKRALGVFGAKHGENGAARLNAPPRHGRTVTGKAAARAAASARVRRAAVAAPPVFLCVPSTADQAVTSGNADGSNCAAPGATAVGLPSSATDQQTLVQVLPYLTFNGSGIGGQPTVTVTGANVQVQSASGATDGPTDGTGNLVIGYDENPGDQSGSNNLVVGNGHTFNLYGALVGGQGNIANGPYTAVLGTGNTASGNWSSVTGGNQNVANDQFSSVAGGCSNIAGTGPASGVGCGDNTGAEAVLGGFSNVASGPSATASGGTANIASGIVSSVTGGQLNQATDTFAAVTGGCRNVAGTGIPTGSCNGTGAESILGGFNNTASGINSAIGGGAQNTANGLSSSVSGGLFNTAMGDASAVSGGDSNTASGKQSAVAGGLFRTQSTDQHTQVGPSNFGP